MQTRTLRRGVSGSLAAVVVAALSASGGCGRSDDGGATIPIAFERKVRPRVVKATPMRPLTPATGAPPAAPAAAPELRLAPNLSVDARVLIITADGTEAAFEAIEDALGYLGTPYDVLNATTGPTLTAATLADGDHGRYQAVFLDVGDLSVKGASAFSNDEWMTLSAYEARFGVRRVAAYTYPSSAYGLVTSGGSIDPEKNPITTHCSAAGAATFVGLNCANPMTIDAGWAYPAHAMSAQTIPLLTDDTGNVYAATTTYPDGREALVLTFAQATYVFHTPQLGYGLVSWATRGLFVGEHHAYLSAQIDDLFLASTIYPEAGATYRMTDHDMQALADWQTARRADAMTAGLRLAWAANLEGSRGVANDPLTAKAVALGPTFGWISHTWDHADMTNMSYATAYSELSQNDQTIRHLGLTPYAVQNLVTPGITGLDNASVMQAAYDVGIRQLVSDTSVAGQNNPSPNAGIWNAFVPGILEIPRHPTDLDYDVSTPAEWTLADNARDGKTQTYDEIVSAESRHLAAYLLWGANDPWMFHQANTRDYGGGRSLLGDLLGATIDRYRASGTFPIISPNMDELAVRVIDRMRLDASGVVATIQPGDKVTVQVTNAARVPLTGVCTPNAETYGGQTITYVDLPAGGSVTLSLADCSPGTTGTGGSGGAGGAGGPAGGAGGTGGAAGIGGDGGSTGAGGATGGTGGATSGTGMAGATGASGSTGGAGSTGASGASGGAGSIGAAGQGGSIITGRGGSGGGVSTGTGGATGEAGNGMQPGSSGCDCAVDPGQSRSGLALMLVAGGIGLSRRRRPCRR